MLEVEKWKLVNGCQTKQDLLAAIDLISDNGTIEGQTGNTYTTDKVKRGIEMLITGTTPANVVTRSYGIRQQVLYLMHYGEK